MIEKITAILGSVRFWGLFITFVIQLLAYYQVLPQQVIDYISAFLLAVIVLGSADSVAKKIGGDSE